MEYGMGGGGGAFVASLHHLAIDPESLSSRSAVPNPNSLVA